MKLNEGKIFYFSTLNVKIYYLIIFVICSLFRRILPYIIENNYAELEIPNFNKSCLFNMVSNISGDLLPCLYKIYLCIFNKDKKTNKKNKLIKGVEEIEYDTLEPKKEERKKKQEEQKDEMKKNFFFIMIIIAIVDIIAQLCLLVFSYIDKNGCTLGFKDEACKEKEKVEINEDDLIFTVAINIFFRYIFSRLFLIIYITYHNKFSLIITFISFIPLIIFNFITLFKIENNKGKEMITYIFLNIFATILYAFEDVMNKVALNKLVIRPYELMFYKAIIQIPFFIFTLIIVVVLDIYNDTENILDYLNKNKSIIYKRIIYRFSFIISNLFRTLSLISVIEKLSPNDLFILKALEFVFLSIFSMVKDINDSKNIIYFIIEIICCVLIFFAGCIANEIIIINRFNLAKETNFFKGEKPFIEDEIINESQDSIN